MFSSRQVRIPVIDARRFNSEVSRKAIFGAEPQKLRRGSPCGVLRTVFIAAITALALSTYGCSGLKGDGVTDLTLDISVTDGVNPDRKGRPSPVFLQVFELRDGGAFRNAEYLDVYRDAREALAGSYIATSEVGPLYPGTETIENLRLSPTALAVGMLGEFNRYQDMDSNMQLIELTPGKDKTIKLVVDSRGIWLR